MTILPVMVQLADVMGYGLPLSSVKRYNFYGPAFLQRFDFILTYVLILVVLCS